MGKDVPRRVLRPYRVCGALNIGYTSGRLIGHRTVVSLTALTQISNEANLLRAKVEAIGMASSSEEGARWLLKALHPAEPSVSGVRIPDGTAMDTVAVETCLTYSLAPAAATPWGAEMTLLPHPTCLMDIYPTDGAIAAAPITLRNTLFKGATADEDIGVLLANAEEWRMTSMSATIHLDANATKDSGTVVAAQIPVRPHVFIPYGNDAVANAQYAAVPILWFDAKDQATYSELMQMPRAYQSNLRAGLYMPLRLTNTSQHWKGIRELCKLVNRSMIVNAELYGADFQPYIQSTATTAAYPNWDLSPAKRANNHMQGAAMSAFLGDSFGRIVIKNVDPSSAVVIKIKLGLELKVQPTSPQAVHLEKAPNLDPVAIASYYAVSRQLPDAYPADYNDGGKILGMISKAIRALSPALAMLAGPMAGPVNAMAGGAAALLDHGAQRMKAKKQNRQANQAAQLMRRSFQNAVPVTPTQTIMVNSRGVPVSSQATFVPRVISVKKGKKTIRPLVNS